LTSPVPPQTILWGVPILRLLGPGPIRLKPSVWVLDIARQLDQQRMMAGRPMTSLCVTIVIARQLDQQRMMAGRPMTSLCVTTHNQRRQGGPGAQLAFPCRVRHCSPTTSPPGAALLHALHHNQSAQSSQCPDSSIPRIGLRSPMPRTPPTKATPHAMLPVVHAEEGKVGGS